MSLEDKAAQLVMIDLPEPELAPEHLAHLRRYAWNGVLLFAKNIRDRAQVCELIRQINESISVDPLVAIDQEGGLVDRVRFADSVLTPGNMALAATGRPQLTRRAYAIMGENLRQLGFNLDFAPCVDVNNNPDNPIIGARSFGENAAQVALHTKAAVLGLRDSRVAANAKHFPGHGDCSQDSHIELPTNNASRERLEQVELVPFRAAVEVEVESIMTAHITFPAFESRPGLPATLSHATLTGLLREDMGYTGVVFTDSLAMQAISDNFGLEEATVLSIEAGADIIIACGSFSDQVRSVQAIVAAVQSGRLTAERLERSVERILELKARYPSSPSLEPNASYERQTEDMRNIIEHSITLVKNNDAVLPLRAGEGKVLLLGPDLLPVTPLGESARSESLKPYLGLPDEQVEEMTYPASPDGAVGGYFCTAAAAADKVVLLVYGRHRLSDSLREFAGRLLAANPRLILVSLSSPYLLRDLPGALAYVVAYNYTHLSLEALGKALTGRIPVRGHLPVSIPGLYPIGHGLEL